MGEVRVVRSIMETGGMLACVGLGCLVLNDGADRFFTGTAKLTTHMEKGMYRVEYTDCPAQTGILMPLHVSSGNTKQAYVFFTKECGCRAVEERNFLDIEIGNKCTWR